MYITFTDFIFCMMLVFPLAVFYYLMKKHWADKELLKMFWHGLCASVFAIVLVRIFYVPVELALGGDMRAFLTSPRDWKVTLSACIGIIGFIEEGLKAFVVHLCCYINRKEGGFRATSIFMAFCGCNIGFALIENIQYYLSFGPVVVFPRVLISSVAHLFFGCICACFASISFKRDKSPIKATFIVAVGIILASVIHGSFDFTVFQLALTSLNGLILAFAGIAIYFAYEVWIMCLRLDYQKPGVLAVCNVCRGLTVEPIRFCPFCGNRVVEIENLPTIIRDMSQK